MLVVFFLFSFWENWYEKRTNAVESTTVGKYICMSMMYGLVAMYKHTLTVIYKWIKWFLFFFLENSLVKIKYRNYFLLKFGVFCCCCCVKRNGKIITATNYTNKRNVESWTKCTREKRIIGNIYESNFVQQYSVRIRHTHTHTLLVTHFRIRLYWSNNCKKLTFKVTFHIWMTYKT